MTKKLNTLMTALLGAIVGSLLVGHTYASYVPRAPHEVFAITTGACPAYSTELTAARGRVMVGLPSGGTNAGTVGSVLTNLENRNHTHSVPALALGSVTVSTTSGSTGTESANHVHGGVTAGGDTSGGASVSHTHPYTAPTGGLSGSTDTGTSGNPSTTIAPYIQYMFCEVN